MSDFLSPAINDVLKGDDMDFDKKLRRIVLGDAPDEFLSDNMLDKPNQVKKLFLDTIEKAKPPLPYAGDHYNDGFIRAVDEFESSLKKEISHE